MDITAFLKDRRTPGKAMSRDAKELRDQVQSRWRTTGVTNQIKSDIRDGIHANGAVIHNDGIATSYTSTENSFYRRVESQRINREFIAEGEIGSFPNITGSLVGFLAWCTIPNTTRDKVIALVDEAERSGHMDAQDATIERLHA